MDRASAAVPGLTADMGPGEVEVLPDEMDEEGACLDVGRDLLSVNGHRNVHMRPFSGSL
jgi:hypothetical protein